MPILEMTSVRKRYGGVHALSGASLSAEAGEVHGLLGPNGSGKSTLNKALAGSVAPDEANILIDGRLVSIKNPMDAHRNGIAAVYQQLSLVPQLTVAQNMELGVESRALGFLTPGRSRARVSEVLERFRPALGDDVTLGSRVEDLSPGQQQVLEIAKAVLRRPRILILDEATASLRRDQVDLVFGIIRELCQKSVSVIFVSHRLEEIMELCTRATILRAGVTVATVTISETSEKELVHLMVGDVVSPPRRDLTADHKDKQRVSLEVENLSGNVLRGVSFTAHQGEVVGLGGLQGQGQSELLLTLFGAHKSRSGTISLSGKITAIHSSRAAAAAGLALVPGDRGTQGMFAGRPIVENISIVSMRRRTRGGIFLSAARERKAAETMVEKLRIKLGSLQDPVSSLSGGNQQKVIIAKWLLNTPRIILLDDPTKGIDIGAKSEIYALIRELAANGATVIFNSSDDRELVEIADRVLVMYEGQVRRELNGDQVTHDSLVSAALLIGVHDSTGTAVSAA